MVTSSRRESKLNFNVCPTVNLGFPSIFGATERRERLQILWEIMQCGTKPVNKTNLMYKVGLSHFQTEQYLGFLISRGFLAKQNAYICTTEKGKQFLSLLIELADMLRSHPENGNQEASSRITLDQTVGNRKNSTTEKGA